MAHVPKSVIVIIGSGIIGLTTALRLLSILDRSKFDVLIVSQEWPTSIPGAPSTHSVNYASMWAGAHVRPIPASTSQLVREAAWLKRTVKVFDAQSRQTPSIGVTSCKGIELLEAPSGDYEQQTAESFSFESGLKNYRKYSPSELPSGVRLGYEYDTYCINAPVYCANLLRKFIVQGGLALQQRLTSEWEAYGIVPNVRLVINASGIGFGDAKCFPTRGQTVLTDYVAATKTVTRQKRDGSWSFVIPRFFDGGTVLGGTKQPWDWRTEPDLPTRERLLIEGSQTAELSSSPSGGSTNGVKVIADIVGRRPTREGGMRVEVEQMEGVSGRTNAKALVIHVYGAGGRGFEISWGVADEVVELIKVELAKQALERPRL